MSVKLGFPAAILASLVTLALPTSGLGGTPKNSGLYEGTLYANGATAIVKVVRLKVAATGKSARVTWSCGGRPPSTIQFAINRDGTFKAFSNIGLLTVWSFVGRFVSPTKVRAVLHLNATCDGRGGTLDLALKG